MKSINGNNKQERQINKAKKYLNIDLKNSSNNYLEIEKFDEENTFAFLGEGKIIEQFGSYAFNPVNSKDEKAIWKKTYSVIEATLNKKQSFFIFKSWDGDHSKLIDLAIGCDDLIKLSDFKGKKIFIKKN